MIEVKLPNHKETFFQLFDLRRGDIFSIGENLFVYLGGDVTYCNRLPIVFNTIGLSSGKAHYIPIDTVVEPIYIDFGDDEEDEDERKDL